MYGTIVAYIQHVDNQNEITVKSENNFDFKFILKYVTLINPYFESR